MAMKSTSIAPGHELEGLLQALVLAADVLDADLLAAELARVEADALLDGDAHEDERPAGLENADRLVDGLLLAAALEDDVQAERLAALDLGDDVLRRGFPVQSAPASLAAASRRASTFSVT